MTPREMEAACLAAMAQPGMMLGVTLTTPRGQRMPQGFPRGELLSETHQSINRSYKPQAVLRWLRENMLIEAVSATAPSRKGGAA
jgi:hypothetical protein